MPDNVVGGFSNEGIEDYRNFRGDYGRRTPLHLSRPRHVPPPSPGEPPWTYVVLTPPGGIPAMWEETVYDEGTGSGTQNDDLAGTGSGTVGDAGDRPGFADCDVYQLQDQLNNGKPLHHPRLEPLGFTITVYNKSFTAIPGGHFYNAVRDPWGFWYVDQAASSATASGLWGRLTGKSYPPGGYIQYTFELVADSDSPTAVTWTDQSTTGIAYEANNVDVPVALDETPGTGTGTHTTQDEFPTIVLLWKGAGDYYLFWAVARIEIVQIESGSAPEWSGFIKGYDQSNPSDPLFNFEACLIVDANALP